MSGAKMEDVIIRVCDREISITNPGKVLWESGGITKLEYIKYLLAVSPHLLKYTVGRALTMIRWPHGITGKHFYQKDMPVYAPDWISWIKGEEKRHILLNDAATLVWVANQAALEIHVPFNRYNQEDRPTELVFDLDPMDEDNFALVREVALITKEILGSLGLFSVVKTSGATGLQIHVPIKEGYTYEEARTINRFIAEYIAAKHPSKITLERSVKKRGKLLYFDYLQMWRGRTLPAPYSVRARPYAPVATPLEWKEVEQEFYPAEFNLFTVRERLNKKGDLFSPVTSAEKKQDLSEILKFLRLYKENLVH